MVSAMALAVALGLWPVVAGAANSTQTDRISGVTLSGCNTLVFGYAINGHRHPIVSNDGFQCTGNSPSVPDQTISYPSHSKLTLYLRDVSCKATYYSDGTGTADHARVSGADPYQVDIADAGSNCSLKKATRIPDPGNGNLDVLSDQNVG
jgi:hypothetical protein